MNLTCKYSGIPFTAQYFTGLQLKSVTEVAHPIFSLPAKQLWSRISDFHLSMEKEEQKLVFVALLASTRLVQFRCAARPEQAVVLSCFDRLVKIAAWLETEQNPQDRYPLLVISKGHENLISLSAGWLASMEETHADVMREGSKPKLFGAAKEAALKQMRREQALERIIQRTGGVVGSHSKMLSEWLITVCKIPADEMVNCGLAASPISMHSFIQQVYACKEEDLLRLPVEDISYLEEYILDSMPQELIGSRPAEIALRRLRDILASQRKAIGMLLEDYSFLEESDLEVSSQELLSLPNVANFKTRVAYLVAKASYQQQQAAILRLASKQEESNDSNHIGEQQNES